MAQANHFVHWYQISDHGLPLVAPRRRLQHHFALGEILRGNFIRALVALGPVHANRNHIPVPHDSQKPNDADSRSATKAKMEYSDTFWNFLSLQRVQHKILLTPPEVRHLVPVHMRHKKYFMLPYCKR